MASRGQKSSKFESLLSRFEAPKQETAPSKSNASPASTPISPNVEASEIPQAQLLPTEEPLATPPNAPNAAPVVIAPPSTTVYTELPTGESDTPVAVATPAPTTENWKTESDSAAYTSSVGYVDLSSLSSVVSPSSLPQGSSVTIETPSELDSSGAYTDLLVPDTKPPIAASQLVVSHGAMYTEDISFLDIDSTPSDEVKDVSNAYIDAMEDETIAIPSRPIYGPGDYILDEIPEEEDLKKPNIRPETGDYLLPDTDESSPKTQTFPASYGYSSYTDEVTSEDNASATTDDAYAVEDLAETTLKGDAYLTTEAPPPVVDKPPVTFGSSYLDLDIEDPSSAFELNENPNEMDDLDEEVMGAQLLRSSSRASLRNSRSSISTAATSSAYGSYSESAPSAVSSVGGATTGAYSLDDVPLEELESPGSSSTSSQRATTPRSSSSHSEPEAVPPSALGASGSVYVTPAPSSSNSAAIDSASSSGYSSSASSDSSYVSEMTPQQVAEMKRKQHPSSALSRSRPGATALSSNVHPDNPSAKFDASLLTTGQAIQEVLDSKGTWNQRFQAIYDAPDSEQKYDALHRLSTDFLGVAETYGKVIIAELSLPDEEKSIKPIKIGGVAGGSKYAVRGLLFKFAVDVPPHFLYGSDEYAQKAAGHELKGLNQWSLNSEGLHFPLMALVRYCGFTLVALSMLPIGNGSLVYGSDDAGRTVHFDDDVLYDKMMKTALNLNLKGHYLVADPTKLIYGPGDIEGHLGEDGLHYVLDYARVYPPAALVQGEIKEKARCLFRLLRPELVSRFGTPLSSDAFTAWGRMNADIHNAEVRLATQSLVDETIPQLAQKLVELSHGHLLDYTREFHLHGVNVRYLGLVRRVVYSLQGPTGEMHCWLLREMVVRTIKTILNQKWRELIKKYQRITPDRCIQEAVGVLNAFVEPQTTAGSISFWREKIRKLLEVKFPLALLDTENETDSNGVPTVDLQKLVFGVSSYVWSFLFKRLSELTGITFNPHVVETTAVFPNYGVLTAGDIVEIRTSVKQMSLVDFAYVMSKSLNALRQLSSSLATRLFTLAIARLKNAPEISVLVLKRLLSLKQYIVRTLKRMKWAENLISKVGELVDVALHGAQQMSNSLPTELATDAAVFLHEIHASTRSSDQKIIKYLEKAIETNPFYIKPYIEITKIHAFAAKPDLDSTVRTWLDKTTAVAKDDPISRLQLGALILTLHNAFSNRYNPGEDYKSATDEVLDHWTIVKEKDPALFLQLDLLHFTLRTDITGSIVGSAGYVTSNRSRSFAALIFVAERLQSPELDQNIKTTMAEDFNTIYFMANEKTGWTAKMMDYVSSLGPFPHFNTLSLSVNVTKMDNSCESGFTKILSQCPNLMSIEMASSVDFKGEFLSALNPSIIRTLDLVGSTLEEEHLEAIIDAIVDEKVQNPLISTLLVPKTIGAECLVRVLDKLAKREIFLNHLRCSCVNDELLVAIYEHSKNLEFISFADCEAFNVARLQEIIDHLGHLKVIDCAATSVQDPEMPPIASKSSIHPTLEIIVSATGCQYFFSASKKRSIKFVSGHHKPVAFHVQLLPEEWVDSLTLLKFARMREKAVPTSPITLVTVEKSVIGSAPQNATIFGRIPIGLLKSISGVVALNSHLYWTLGSFRLAEIKVPNNMTGHAVLAWYNNGALKTSHPTAHVSHILRTNVPMQGQPDQNLLLQSSGGSTSLSVNGGYPINYWALAILSFIRTLPV